MNISVIIPVYHPDEKLAKAVRLLGEQKAAVDRILLMDTLEKDGTSILRPYLDAEGIADSVTAVPVKAEDFDHGGTRALGAELCPDADFFLFMTQDAVPADQYLTENLVQFLCAHKDMAVCGARQLAYEDAREEEKISREFNYPEVSGVKTEADIGTLGIKTFFCSNVCAMYRSDVYRKLGGFIRHTVFNEDMIFAAAAIRQGYSVGYCAQACVYHSHNYTARQQFRRNFDLGVSQTDHPEVFASVPSEGEGLKYVKTVARRLLSKGKAGETAGFLVRCAARYLGYRKGKNYKKAAPDKIRKWTLSPAYWEKDPDFTARSGRKTG